MQVSGGWMSQYSPPVSCCVVALADCIPSGYFGGKSVITRNIFPSCYNNFYIVVHKVPLHRQKSKQLPFLDSEFHELNRSSDEIRQCTCAYRKSHFACSMCQWRPNRL